MNKGKRLEEKHLGIIVISLVPEAEMTDDKEIEKQIKEESFIPFLAESSQTVKRIWTLKEDSTKYCKVLWKVENA